MLTEDEVKMPAYHSKASETLISRSKMVGNTPLLPIKVSKPFWKPGTPFHPHPACLQISDRKFGRPVVDEWSPDPGNPEGGSAGDIIDECLEYYKSNIFFPAYEIKNAADRLIIYGILYVTLALKT